MINDEDFLEIKQEKIEVKVEVADEYLPESSIINIDPNQEKEFGRKKTENSDDGLETASPSADENELPKEDTKFICKVCDYYYSSNKLYNLDRHFILRHINYDKNIYFQCEICDYKYDLKRDLIEHIQREHPRFKCTRCEECFKFTDSLHKHILREHIGEPSQSYECPHCSRQFQIKHKLNKHLRIHLKRFKCLECEYATYEPNKLKLHNLKHKSIDEIKGFECTICNAKFKTKNSLKSHCESKHTQFKCEETSETSNYLYCTLCDFKTWRKAYLAKHMKRNHSGDDVKKKCNYCSYSSPDVSKLKEHVIRKHTPDEESIFYECNECDYKCKIKRNLKKHIEAHHMEIRIKCDQCDYSAKDKTALKQHMYLRHTPDDQIKYFQCDQCDYKTKTKRLLQKHSRNIHVKPKRTHQCEQCHFASYNKSRLKTHITRMHTPEDQITYSQCDHCGFKTKIRSDLQRHISRIHDGKLKARSHPLSIRVLTKRRNITKVKIHIIKRARSHPL